MSLSRHLLTVGRAVPSKSIRPDPRRYNGEARRFLEEAATGGDGVAKVVLREVLRHEALLKKLAAPEYQRSPAGEREKLIEQSAEQLAEAHRRAALDRLNDLHAAAEERHEAFEAERTGTQHATLRAKLSFDEDAARIRALGDKELEALAYSPAWRDWAPHALDLAVGELRSRGNGKAADTLRAAAVAGDYQEPWGREENAEANARFSNFEPTAVAVRFHGPNQAGVETSFYTHVPLGDLVNGDTTPELPKLEASNE